ncbi:hypothetical protein BH09ACT7_BH09ACT7_09160 [soil metagenome]
MPRPSRVCYLTRHCSSGHVSEWSFAVIISQLNVVAAVKLLEVNLADG